MVGVLFKYKNGREAKSYARFSLRNDSYGEVFFFFRSKVAEKKTVLSWVRISKKEIFFLKRKFTRCKEKRERTLYNLKTYNSTHRV